MRPGDATVHFTLRLSRSERAALERLAEIRGGSCAGEVRAAIDAYFRGLALAVEPVPSADTPGREAAE